jgi:Flp pilus assembly protein TadG
MAMILNNATQKDKRGPCDSGQAILECALSVLVMLSFMFGMIDFSRAIYEQQEVTSLAAQAANLSMRGTALGTAASSAVSASSNLNLGSNGKVIISAVYMAVGAHVPQVTAQGSAGGITATSKVGSTGGNASLPSGAVPPAQQTVYAAEVFYKYQAITPIGKLVAWTLPTQLYDVAYY